MNAIDRKMLVQRLERDADAEAWADEFLYKHPKFIAGIVYYANRMLEEIESGAFDIKQPEVPDLYVDLLDKLIEGLQKLYLIMKTDHDQAHEAEAYDVCDLLEEPLEIVQNILHEIGVTVE
jgi:hypothetical protein